MRQTRAILRRLPWSTAISILVILIASGQEAFAICISSRVKVFDVKGTVLGSSYADPTTAVPLPQATLSLVPLREPSIPSRPVATTTDENGNFSFPKVKRGRYRIRASLPGFQVFEAEVRVIRFSLRPKRSLVIGLYITSPTCACTGYIGTQRRRR
jgi:hypothetical protein